MSCRITLDVKIVWKDLFNYTIQYLLEYLDGFVF